MPHPVVAGDQKEAQVIVVFVIIIQLANMVHRQFILLNLTAVAVEVIMLPGPEDTVI